MSEAKYIKQALANMKTELRAAMVERLKKKMAAKAAKSAPPTEEKKDPVEEALAEEPTDEGEELDEEEETEDDDGLPPAILVAVKQAKVSRESEPQKKRGPGRPPKPKIG